MAEYSNRSNDPRITGGAKKDNYKYEMALEVARQPASTPYEKKMKKNAENYAKAFESRFQDEAFKLSGGKPLSAGGKGAYKSPQKVNLNVKDKKIAKKDERKIIASGSSKRIGDYKQVKPGSMASNTKITSGTSAKKASTKYSPAPMSAKQKETTRRAAEKKQAVKNIKKDLTKVAGVAGKVAGKVTSTAKKVAKAEVGAAKTAVGFATKAAKFNSDMVLKGAKAGAKALAKEPRLKREFKMGGSIKKLKDSSDKASKKK